MYFYLMKKIQKRYPIIILLSWISSQFAQYFEKSTPNYKNSSAENCFDASENEQNGVQKNVNAVINEINDKNLSVLHQQMINNTNITSNGHEQTENSETNSYNIYGLHEQMENETDHKHLNGWQTAQTHLNKETEEMFKVPLIQSVENKERKSKRENCEEKVFDLTKNVSDLTEKVSRLAEKVSHLSKNVSDMTEKVSDLTEKFTEKVSNLTEMFTGKVSKLTEMFTEKFTKKVSDLTEKFTENISVLTEKFSKKVSDIAEKDSDPSEKVSDVTRKSYYFQKWKLQRERNNIRLQNTQSVNYKELKNKRENGEKKTENSVNPSGVYEVHVPIKGKEEKTENSYLQTVETTNNYGMVIQEWWRSIDSKMIFVFVVLKITACVFAYKCIRSQQAENPPQVECKPQLEDSLCLVNFSAGSADEHHVQLAQSIIEDKKMQIKKVTIKQNSTNFDIFPPSKVQMICIDSNEKNIVLEEEQSGLKRRVTCHLINTQALVILVYCLEPSSKALGKKNVYAPKLKNAVRRVKESKDLDDDKCVYSVYKEFNSHQILKIVNKINDHVYSDLKRQKNPI